jgi:hypothetical protein
MRTESWLDEIRHGINPSISFGCDYCATTRRKRDFAFWHFGLTVPPTLLAIVDEVIERSGASSSHSSVAQLHHRLSRGPATGEGEADRDGGVAWQRKFYHRVTSARCIS